MSNGGSNSKLFTATAMPDSDWWQALWPNPGKVLKSVGFKQGMTAIDLCCGDGTFTVPMSILLKGHVIAVDLSVEMIAKAKQAVAIAGAPECTWITGDARDIVTLVPQPVDLALIANTFHGVENQAQMAIDVSKSLKPGGRLVVINWHVAPREETQVLGQSRGPKFEMRMSPMDVSAVIEPSGLVHEKTVELPPYHYGAIFKKI